MKKIRVSRHRLTECGGCGAHVRLPDDWRAAVCDLCGARLITGPRAEDPLERLRRTAGRTGAAMAASLLGLSLGAGCIDGDLSGLNGGPLPADAGRAEDDAVARDVGFAADATAPDAAAPDAAAPDAARIDAGAMDSGAALDASDPPPVALYGQVPLDGGIVPSDGAVLEDAGDPVPTPEYGAPPVFDAGTEDVG